MNASIWRITMCSIGCGIAGLGGLSFIMDYLHGNWEYCINQAPTTDVYDGTILVPYAPETLLSGVQKIVTPEDYLHYRQCLSQAGQEIIKEVANGKSTVKSERSSTPRASNEGER